MEKSKWIRVFVAFQVVILWQHRLCFCGVSSSVFAVFYRVFRKQYQ